MTRTLFVAMLLLFSIHQSSLFAEKQPLLLADPFVLEADGSYYIYGTGAKDGIAVYHSKDLKNWSGPCGATNGLALHKKDSHAQANFWAPEVYRVGDRYMMTFSADEHIRYAFADSPIGPFRQDEQASYVDEKGIDSHIFIDDDGTPYMFWVRFFNANVIFSAQMTPDLKHIKMETLKRVIDVEEGTWEKTSAKPIANVAEGPFVIKHEGLYYLTYSCNHFKSPDYAIGYAVASSPMGPWKRHDGNPIVCRHGGYQGTGHHAILKTSAGKIYFVYHAHYASDKITPRRTLISPVEFVQKQGKIEMQVSQKIITPKLINHK